MDFKDAAEDFLLAKEIEEGMSPRTLKAYRYDLQLICKILNNPPIESIRVFHLRKALKYFHEKNYTKRGLARKIAVMKSFFKFLYENKIISENPAMTIKTPRIRMEETLPKFLTEEEMISLLKQVEQLKERSRAWRKRLKLVIHLLYASMIRVSEMCGLKIKDVDFKKAVIKVKGKGNKERYVPLDNHTLDLIKDYLWERAIEEGLLLFHGREINSNSNSLPDTFMEVITFLNPQSSLIVNLRGNPLHPRSVQRDLQKLKTLLGFPKEKKFTPHVFRHTGATHLRQNGMDISELQDLLGHSSPNTTKIYAKNDISTLHRSYVKYHPLAKER